jgi:hypothetical protein
MAQAFVRVFTIILALGGTICVKSFAQSIGPDGRVLPIYSGGTANPAPATPAPLVPPVPALNGAVARSTTDTLPDTKSPVGNTRTCPTVNGAYYLQSDGWISMDPSHSVGFKTTNVAGSAFSYGAAKARVKAQFRDSHSPYQLRSAIFAICLVGITDSGRDITVAKFQEEKDRREISMASYRLWTGVDAQIDPKVIIPVSVEKKGDKVYLVTSSQSLPKGEFILFTIIPDVASTYKANTPSSLGGYDFGHHEQ